MCDAKIRVPSRVDIDRSSKRTLQRYLERKWKATEAGEGESRLSFPILEVLLLDLTRVRMLTSVLTEVCMIQ